MSFNIPFVAINKLLNVENYIEGKIKVSKVESPGDNVDDDDEQIPIITPQPIPNLLLDHSKIEISRVRIENIWNTRKAFPVTKSKKIKCLYCGIKFEKCRPNTEMLRWFLPNRRDKYVTTCVIDEELDERPDVPQQEYTVYSGEGIFCTYFCTHMQITTKKMNTESRDLCMKFLKFMYADIYKKPAPIIETPIIKDHLEEYGGYVSETLYRETALSYERIE